MTWVAIDRTLNIKINDNFLDGVCNFIGTRMTMTEILFPILTNLLVKANSLSCKQKLSIQSLYTHGSIDYGSCCCLNFHRIFRENILCPIVEITPFHLSMQTRNSLLNFWLWSYIQCIIALNWTVVPKFRCSSWSVARTSYCWFIKTKGSVSAHNCTKIHIQEYSKF